MAGAGTDAGTWPPSYNPDPATWLVAVSTVARAGSLYPGGPFCCGNRVLQFCSRQRSISS